MTDTLIADRKVAAPTRTQPDTRRLWRILLAVVAPLPWLAKGVYYAAMPDPNVSTTHAITVFTTNHTYTTMQWFDTVFVMLLVPAAMTAAWIARRGAPRLATAAALLTITGFLAGISRNINGDQLAYVAAQKHLNPHLVSRYVDALEANPTAGLGGLLFILGLNFGSVVLGIALWRSRAIPAWACIAVAVGGFTHPFLQFNHIVVAVGLCVLAAGYAAISIALLRMRDDDFDLPPLNAGH